LGLNLKRYVNCGYWAIMLFWNYSVSQYHVG